MRSGVIPRPRPPWSALALLFAPALTACSSIATAPDGGGVDAAREASADAVATGDRAVIGPGDGAVDARRDAAPSQRFGPCEFDADCAGSLGCDNRYAGGRCVAACTANADCGAGEHCFQGECRTACESAQGSCGASEVCVSVPEDPVAQMVCVPSCYADPAHSPACDPGLVCDPFTGDCVVTPAVSGLEVGDPCVRDDQCRTLDCVEESPDIGNVGGYCITVARSPAPEAYMANQPLPQTNCPPGSVPLPVGGIPMGEGYPALCLRHCSAGGDCRPGYDCARGPAVPSGNTSDGVCVPIDCLDAAHSALANNGCPSGFTCRMVTGTTVGRCGR